MAGGFGSSEIFFQEICKFSSSLLAMRILNKNLLGDFRVLMKPGFIIILFM
jgi:hypothetical protein